MMAEAVGTMATILELRTARTPNGTAGREMALAAEASSARMLTELEIAKARLDRSFSGRRSRDPLGDEIDALRRALVSLEIRRCERGARPG